MTHVFEFIKNSHVPLLSYVGIQILYSSIVFAIIWILTRMLRKKSSYWHLGLWSLVLIRLVLPPDLNTPFSGRYILGKMSFVQNLFGTDGNNTVLYGMEEQASTDNELISLNNQNYVSDNNNVWTLAVFTIWGAGIILFFGVYLSRFLKFRKLIRNARVISNQNILKIIERWRSRFHIRRQVRIVCSNNNVIPFTIGTLRPVIYIPSHILKEKDDNTLESIIAHEIAHIKRYDDVFIRIQSLIQIVYFFHPVVWMTMSRINLARECTCDSLVLSKHIINAKTYSHCILDVLKSVSMKYSIMNPLPAFGDKQTKLKDRFENIKGEHNMNKLHFVYVFCILFLIGFTILPMAKVTEQESVASASITPDESIIQVQTAAYLVALALVQNALDADTDNQLQSDQISSTNEKSETISFIKPIHSDKITARFGKMKHPFKKTEVFHRGIDIRANKGTDVYACADGVVVKTQLDYTPNKGTGIYVTVQHANEFSSRYTHLSEITVSEGQEVKAGDVIAKVGSTGLSTGPHLHFELMKKNEPVDPATFIDFE